MKMGWEMANPRTNSAAARAEVMHLTQRGDRQVRELVAELIESECNAVWEANTPREKVLRLYKFLHQLGYTVIGIDAAIERERTKNKSADSSSDATKTTRP